MPSPSVRNVEFVTDQHAGYRAFRRNAIARNQAHRSIPTALSTAGPIVASGTAQVGARPEPANTEFGPALPEASGIAYQPVRETAGDDRHVDDVFSGESAGTSRFDPRPCAVQWDAKPKLSRAHVGYMGEKAARRYLGQWLKLYPGRILTWRRPNYQGKLVTGYQELDAVTWLDENDPVIYEVKLTTVARMREQAGIEQLAHAATIIPAKPRIYSVRRRLVYIGTPATAQAVGAEMLKPNDITSPFGIIWITPDELEWAARDIGQSMPEGWRGLWDHHDNAPTPLDMAA